MDNKMLQMLIQGASGGVGAAAGAVTGGPAGVVPGMTIGTGMGQLISSGIGLSDKPDFPGASPEMKTAEFLAGEVATEATMMESVSASDVSKFAQGGRTVGQRESQELATATRMMSPLDKARITESLLSRAGEVKHQVDDSLKGYIEGGKAKQLLGKIQATSSYATIAERVRTAEMQKKLVKLENDRQMDAMFSDTVSRLISSFASPVLDIGGRGEGAAAPILPAPVTDPNNPAKAPNYQKAVREWQDHYDEKVDLFSVPMVGG